MSTKTEITRLQNAKSAIKTAIEGKGVTVPDITKLDGMAALIDSISSGGTSSEIQPSKSLTITSNGITTITPDEPYDALKKVDVTVNVANGGVSGETTSLQVNITSGNIESPIYCLWQTSNGWMGTGNFDTSTNFTIPNVFVGGYVIFTKDPSAQTYFSTANEEGVEHLDCEAMDPEWDIINAALIMKVTAPAPSFYISIMPG